MGATAESIVFEGKDADTLISRESDVMSQRGKFGLFCREAWVILEPETELKWNWHLDAMAAYLEAYFCRDNGLNRLILNIPPGGMKSLMVSVFLPAWGWTREPGRRYVNLTNESKLATRDSLRMKNLVESEWYQDRWGHKVKMSATQNEKTLFENTKKGFRQGLGFRGNISGKRGTDLIIDDPIDTQKAFSDVENAAVNNTYDQAVSSRLNDLDADGIVLIMQRTRTNDLTGHILGKENQHWVHFRVAMESEGSPGYDPVKDIGMTHYDGRDIRDRRKADVLMFPDRFSAKAVASLKEDLGEYGTAGQLQQRPEPLGGGIIKEAYWKMWPKEVPLPVAEHIFLSWDTAFTEKDLKTNSYSAMTAWGVFWHEQMQAHCLMVLGRWYGRVSYPVLRRMAQKMTVKYGPDAHLIEKKASGQSLIQDLRRTGSGKKRVRLRTTNPDIDKVARAHAASPTIEAGMVYMPEREWAKTFIKIVGTFPTGEPPSEDLTDTVTQAILYLKRRWWITHPDDVDLINQMPEEDQDYDEADERREIQDDGIYG